jgi:hypothetical protein
MSDDRYDNQPPRPTRIDPLRTPSQNSPAKPTAAAARTAVQTSKFRSRLQRKLNRKRLVRIVLPLAVVAAGILTFALTRPHFPFNPDIKNQVKAPVYYPAYLPKSYQLDAESATVTSGTLTFVAGNGQKGRSLFFSEQPKPSSVDFNSFYQSQIPDPINISLGDGNATIGHFKNISPLEQAHLGESSSTKPQSVIASYTTSKVWIIITGPADFDLDALKKVVSRLTKS